MNIQIRNVFHIFYRFPNRRIFKQNVENLKRLEVSEKVIDFQVKLIICHREGEGQGNEIEDVESAVVADLFEVAEQIDFVGNFGVILEVIDGLAMEYQRVQVSTEGNSGCSLCPKEIDFFQFVFWLKILD